MGWLAGASVALLLLGMLFWQSLSLRAESRRLAESAPGKLKGERASVEFPARAISQACGLIALALGVAVLLGWLFDVTALKRVLPGLFAMQPWAAITIALDGGALLAAAAPGRIAPAVPIALAGMVGELPEGPSAVHVWFERLSARPAFERAFRGGFGGA